MPFFPVGITDTGSSSMVRMPSLQSLPGCVKDSEDGRGADSDFASTQEFRRELQERLTAIEHKLDTVLRRRVGRYKPCMPSSRSSGKDDRGRKAGFGPGTAKAGAEAPETKVSAFYSSIGGDTRSTLTVPPLEGQGARPKSVKFDEPHHDIGSILSEPPTMPSRTSAGAASVGAASVGSGVLLPRSSAASSAWSRWAPSASSLWSSRGAGWNRSRGVRGRFSKGEKVTVQRSQQRVTWIAEDGLSVAERIMTAIGEVDNMKRMRSSMEDPSGHIGWDFLHSGHFTMLCSSVIVANALFAGYRAAAVLEARMTGDVTPPLLDIVELVFAVFFGCELCLRLAIERCLFFLGHEWKWNFLDAILVVTSILDLAFAEMFLGTPSASLGRMLRLVRFLRLARITRVIRHFSSLRLVVFAILDSMGSLFWCFIVIGLLIYVFAVLFLNAATDHFHQGAYTGSQRSDEIVKYYGSMDKAMVTLFQVISGGLDWRDAAEPFSDDSSVYHFMFLLYVFVMHFGVLNVVVGTFVATATEIASRDREALVRYELRQWEHYAHRIRTFFQEADQDKSGTLTWEEFKSHLKQRKVKAYFQAMELDVSQAHVLFELLDADGTNEVTIDEFVDGCMRLKGQAQRIDMNMLMLSTRRVMDQLLDFIDWSEATFVSMADKLEALDQRCGNSLSIS